MFQAEVFSCLLIRSAECLFACIFFHSSSISPSHLLGEHLLEHQQTWQFCEIV